MKKKGLITSIIGICIIGGVSVGGYSAYTNEKANETANIKAKVNTKEMKIEDEKTKVQAVTITKTPAQKKVEEKEAPKEEVVIDKKVTNLNENTKEEVVHKNIEDEKSKQKSQITHVSTKDHKEIKSEESQVNQTKKSDAEIANKERTRAIAMGEFDWKMQCARKDISEGKYKEAETIIHTYTSNDYMTKKWQYDQVNSLLNEIKEKKEQENKPQENKHEEKKNTSNEKAKGDGYTYANALATLKRSFGAKADEYNYSGSDKSGDNNGFGYLIGVSRKDNKSDGNIGAWQVKPSGEVIQAG
ncbi:MAG: hypothetical protein ACRCWG_04945 [Sarcina sp.]